MNKKRNFWPLGILAIIVIGIILLIVLVRISMFNPVINDDSYFEEYNEVDKNINTFIKDTKDFQHYYSLYMGANQKPLRDLAHQPLSPYYVKGHRDKAKEAPKIQLFTNAPNHIYLDLIPKVSPSVISDIKINLFMIRFHTRGKPLEIGSFECNADGACSSREFKIDKEGRWRAILEVRYNYNNESKKIYFEKEFFASELP